MLQKLIEYLQFPFVQYALIVGVPLSEWHQYRSRRGVV